MSADYSHSIEDPHRISVIQPEKVDFYNWRVPEQIEPPPRLRPHGHSIQNTLHAKIRWGALAMKIVDLFELQVYYGLARTSAWRHRAHPYGSPLKTCARTLYSRSGLLIAPGCSPSSSA